jgi:hypothetical protein
MNDLDRAEAYEHWAKLIETELAHLRQLLPTDLERTQADEFVALTGLVRLVADFQQAALLVRARHARMGAASHLATGPQAP